MAIQVPTAPKLPTVDVSTAARAAYELAFELSPIILHNGIASFMPLGLLPLVAVNLPNIATTGNINNNSFPFHFVPLPGGTLMENSIGTYSFANQATAANAVISMPKRISMLMLAPVNGAGGYALKLPLMLALVTLLEKHRDMGGTFHVMTPAYSYFDCILKSINDVSGGDGYQQQTRWQLDFEQPLVTQVQLSQALGSAMSRMNAGTA